MQACGRITQYQKDYPDEIAHRDEVYTYVKKDVVGQWEPHHVNAACHQYEAHLLEKHKKADERTFANAQQVIEYLHSLDVSCDESELAGKNMRELLQYVKARHKAVGVCSFSHFLICQL